MSHLDLSIIIINYNTKQVTLDCLKTIFASKTTYTFEVILVDNASKDDSVAAIKKEYPQVKVIASPQNLGFGLANNLGVANAQATYVWILNSDTLIAPQTIQQFLDLAYKNTSYVAACYLKNADGTLQPQGGALPTLANLTTWMTNLDSIPWINQTIPPYQNKNRASFRQTKKGTKATPVWYGGTALLVRRDVYLSTQGFDPHIFMYAEDIDLCQRLYQAGIPIHYFPQVKVIHLGQASGSSVRAVVGEMKGLQYLFKKWHKPKTQQLYLRLLLKLGALLRIIMYTITRQSPQRNAYAHVFRLV
jgi:GT2 family glycosyltransferase